MTKNMSSDCLLGYNQFVEIDKDRCVINLFGQDDYGYEKRQTNYIALIMAITGVLDRETLNVERLTSTL